MPTYDYRCNDCGHEFEEFQSIKADALKTCPKCQKDALERLIGPGAALIFKGSGFYLTDYRSEGYKKSAKAEKESSGGSKPDSGAAKTESAPAKTESPAPAPKPKSDS
jgi:putative FmdB family regulatory protein